MALDPESEIVVTLGSKEGLANLAQAITAPGDVILVPNPSYPIHPYGFIIAGAAIRHVPITPTGDLLAELARATEHSVPPPTAIVLNFPSNPTAQVVDLDFYREVVAFARRHEIFILSDLAYAEIFFDAPPPSILQVAGRQGGRGRVHLAEQDLQHAGLADRLRGRQPGADRRARPDQVVPRLRRVHADPGRGDRGAERRRRTASRRSARAIASGATCWSRASRPPAGRCPSPPATMFVWAPLPEAYRAIGSLAFSKLLLEEAKVAVSPGIGFGEYGEGHVRLALVENRQRIRQAVRNIKTFLARPPPAEPAAQPAPSRGRWPEAMAAAAARRHRRPRHGRQRGAAAARAERRADRRARRPRAARWSRSRRATAQRERGVALDRFRWYDDPLALAADPEVELVVELIGGADGPALALCRAALAAGKPVVTANKALLAHHGAELARLADATRRHDRLRGRGRGRHPDRQDAARGPRRQPHPARLRHPERHLQLHPDHDARDRPRRSTRCSQEAQQLGYAEADPSFDIDGIDAAHKLALLSALAFGCPPDFAAVYTEGIRHVSPLDIAFASEMGYRIKLLGVARLTEHGLEQRVHPSMVRIGTPISQVEGVFNAVVAEGDQVEHHALRRARRRRRPDRLGGGRRPRRPRQGRAPAGLRRAGRASDAPAARRRWTATTAPTTSA